MIFHLKNAGIFAHIDFFFFFIKKTFRTKIINLTSYMHFFNL